MITNKDLKQCSEQLFSYSASYQVPMYGREGAVKEMQERVPALEGGEVLMISQPLGTGKTFLVNYMVNSQRLDIPVGSTFLTVRGILEDEGSMDRFPGDTMVVDEADIKTPVKKLVKGLELLAGYLKESNRKAILLGDYSLRNPEIKGGLQTDLLRNFEDIDRDFLKGVLEQRFKHFLKLEEFQIEEVMEPALIEYLAPEWMKSVNSFRGIFSLFQKVVADNNCVRYNAEKAFLTVEMFREFLCRDEKQPELEEEIQKNFLQALHEYLKETYPKGSGIVNGFQDAELYELARNSGISVSKREFMEDILYPFAAADLLVSTGVPEYEKENGKFVRRPAPYVPSLQMLLSL